MKNTLNKLCFLFLTLPALSGCQEINDNNLSFKVETNNLVNYCDDYNIQGNSLTTYYLDNSDIPYLDVKECLSSLNGFIDLSKIKFDVKKFNNKYYFYYKNNRSLYLKFDWNSNEISSSWFAYFFDVIVKSSSTTNYSSHLSAKGKYIDTPSEVVIDLDDYGFDMYYYNGHLLLPYIFINSLFCSPNYLNLYFNGDTYYCIYSVLTSKNEHYQEIMTSSKNNQTPSEEYRLATYNHLRFVLDYYYGLKDYKKVTSWDEELTNNGIKDKILSLDKEENKDGYFTLLYPYLNDLHTSLASLGYYYPSNYDRSMPSSYLENTKYETYVDTLDELEELRGDKDLVRYSDDTAIITLDEFLTGTNEQVQSEDAYIYDSFYFIKKCMEEISEHSETKNIILDLSTNGGGNVGAMIRVLGYLTDESIYYEINNTLDDCLKGYEYQVDVDMDDDYSDCDSYDEYNWYILTSLCSFSAANTFTAIAKSLNLATVIGQTSGGGMCSVLPTLLMDGTSFRISSTNCFMVKINSESYAIEGGVSPHQGYEIEDYSDFYNDEYLTNLIK